MDWRAALVVPDQNGMGGVKKPKLGQLRRKVNAITEQIKTGTDC